MEISQPISSDDLDLAPVFGALDGELKARVLEELRRAESTLAALRDELGLEGEALTLERYPSGQAEIVTALKGAAGKLTFEAGLRPRNFFSETPWQPGYAPRSMMTDAWDVDGVRGVRTELRVDSARRKPVDGVGRNGGANGVSDGGRNGGRESQGRRRREKKKFFHRKGLQVAEEGLDRNPLSSFKIDSRR